MWQSTAIGRPVPGTGQTLALGAASVQSSAFGSQTYAIHVSALGNCHVQIGGNPTATANDMLVKATDPAIIIHTAPGEKLAVIRDGAATGNLVLIELTN